MPKIDVQITSPTNEVRDISRKYHTRSSRTYDSPDLRHAALLQAAQGERTILGNNRSERAAMIANFALPCVWLWSKDCGFAQPTADPAMSRQDSV